MSLSYGAKFMTAGIVPYCLCYVMIRLVCRNKYYIHPVLHCMIEKRFWDGLSIQR